MELDLNVQVVASPEQVSSQIDDELVILDTKNGRYYGLNEIGSHIWSLIQTPTSLSSIRDSLLAEYDVEPDRCEADLLGIVSALLDRKLVQICNQSPV